MNVTALNRFASYIEVQEDGCWIFNGVNIGGYGNFFNGKKGERAHRWAYRFFIGPIGDGLDLDHLCGNRRCACPEHLEPVTRAENMRRVRMKNMARSHCANGHEFTDENTRMETTQNGNPSRRCRACDRVNRRRYRERQRGELQSARRTEES